MDDADAASKANPLITPREGREGAVRPYPPSWLDRLTLFVTRLPGPNWSYYVGFSIALIVLESVLRWSEGTDPPGTFNWFFTLNAVAISFMLCLLEYLDKVAGSALDKFRPLLQIDDTQYQLLRYELVTLPAQPALLASLIAALFPTVQAVTGNVSYFHEIGMFMGPYSSVVDTLEGAVFWWLLGVLVYHTIRQLRLVSRIFASGIEIRLFETGPLYAFSWLTARTAAGLVLLAYLGFLALPESWLTRPDFGGLALVVVLIAVVTFAWPLLGMHHLLVEEKEHRQMALARRMDAAIGELQRRLDASRIGEADVSKLKEAMESIASAQKEVEKVSTWPWRSATVQGLATAILLPLVLWFITRFLERLITF